MSLLSIVLIFFLSLLEIEASSLTETKRLLKENLLLNSEYHLAKDSQIYVVFNLVEKKVLIKAKGLVLKEYPILSYKRWGYKTIPRPFKLLKKACLIKSGRKRVVPSKDGVNISSDQDFLEVSDMPSRYRLKWNDSIWMSIRPKSESIFSRILNLLFMLKSLMIKPLNFLGYTIMGKKYTEIEIYLNKDDSKSLFWSLQEGYKAIIYMDD